MLDHTFDKRYAESSRIRKKYPDRIPIIIEKDEKCKNIPDIDKKKYLVTCDLTIGQFLFVIRKRIKLEKEKAIYIFIDNKTIPNTTSLINNIYCIHCNNDGFLYITYSGENTFGKI